MDIIIRRGGDKCEYRNYVRKYEETHSRNL